MSSYKLTYFDVMALGEPIRYMLSYMGKQFEDNRIIGENWFQQKNEMPFGKVPILEIDGKTYHQSAEICRYLAIEAKLSGRTALENLEIDQIVGSFNDLTFQIGAMYNTQDKVVKEKLKQTLLDETIPFYMERYEKILEKNEGCLVNGKVTWADFYLVAYSETMPGIFGFDLAEKYPNFGKLKKKVQSLPGVQQWIETRPITSL